MTRLIKSHGEYNLNWYDNLFIVQLHVLHSKIVETTLRDVNKIYFKKKHNKNQNKRTTTRPDHWYYNWYTNAIPLLYWLSYVKWYLLFLSLCLKSIFMTTKLIHGSTRNGLLINTLHYGCCPHCYYRQQPARSQVISPHMILF